MGPINPTKPSKYDSSRGTSTERGYDADWRRLRRLVLTEEPLCRMCLARDIIKPARVVDHIIPIRQRPDLRLVRSNLQSLCKSCHDGAKQQEERLGYSTAVGTDGWPLDPRHPSNVASSMG